MKQTCPLICGQVEVSRSWVTTVWLLYLGNGDRWELDASGSLKPQLVAGCLRPAVGGSHVVFQELRALCVCVYAFIGL